MLGFNMKDIKYIVWPTKVTCVGSIFNFVNCSTLFTLLNNSIHLGFVTLET